jgi:hypothetical protein
MWLVTAVVYKKEKLVSSFPYTIWVFSVKFKDYEWLHFYSGDSVEVCVRRSSFKTLSEKLIYATGPNPCLGETLGVSYRDARRTRRKTTIKNSVLRLRSSPHLTFCIYSCDKKHK